MARALCVAAGQLAIAVARREPRGAFCGGKDCPKALGGKFASRANALSTIATGSVRDRRAIGRAYAAKNREQSSAENGASTRGRSAWMKVLFSTSPPFFLAHGGAQTLTE